MRAISETARRRGLVVALAGGALGLLAAIAGPARSADGGVVGRAEPLPDGLEGVGVTEHIGDVLPVDLEFVNDGGRTVRLGEYFAGEKPVLLTLNYSNCPMLCSLQLNGLVQGLQGLEWTAGNEFEIVTVSIDPLETTALARLTKQKYLADYARAGAGDGWHFLTGEERAIRQLADAVGFGYRYVESRKEYAHTAVTFVITPSGVVSRYLYGVIYDPQTLRLSMVEASEGKVGSTVDRILLFCFHYDATEGRYGPAAVNLMRVGASLTILVLGIVLTTFWRRDRRRRRAEQS